MRLETPMGTSNRIEINPDVMRGKPVIRGTRVTVELLLRKLSEGGTEDSVLASYPHLSREDIKAAIAYAADLVAQHDSSAGTIAPRAAPKPKTGLFSGPRKATGRLIGESDERAPGDSPWRSS